MAKPSKLDQFRLMVAQKASCVTKENHSSSEYSEGEYSNSDDEEPADSQPVNLQVEEVFCSDNPVQAFKRLKPRNPVLACCTKGTCTVGNTLDIDIKEVKDVKDSESMKKEAYGN